MRKSLWSATLAGSLLAAACGAPPTWETANEPFPTVKAGYQPSPEESVVYVAKTAGGG